MCGECCVVWVSCVWRAHLAILSGMGVSGNVIASFSVSTISAPASAQSSANVMAARMSARSTCKDKAVQQFHLFARRSYSRDSA